MLNRNGALVSAVEASSRRTTINVGKTSPLLADWMMEEYNLKGDETMMMGDQLDTDVRFGNVGGMESALVLTGCTMAKEIKELVLGAKNDDTGGEK